MARGPEFDVGRFSVHADARLMFTTKETKEHEENSITKTGGQTKKSWFR
jgi:hypothetical protein